MTRNLCALRSDDSGMMKSRPSPLISSSYATLRLVARKLGFSQDSRSVRRAFTWRMRTRRALSPCAKSGDEAESERERGGERSGAERRAWCRRRRRHKETESLFPVTVVSWLYPGAIQMPEYSQMLASSTLARSRRWSPAFSFLPGAISSTLLANPLISFKALPSHHADGPGRSPPLPAPHPNPHPSAAFYYFYCYCSSGRAPLLSAQPHRVRRAQPRHPSQSAREPPQHETS
ncbi:hypothetical protein Mapa_008468 [Marchantia paleacea]|nr:hypothetical protein Mapa_008468 [Marchantia paleacea]